MHMHNKYTRTSRSTSDNIKPIMSSYISKMPPELLGEIFTYAALLDPDAPLLVGEVSRLFRRVVRCTPHAWRRLHLSLNSEVGADGRDGADYTDEGGDEGGVADAEENGDGRCIRKAELWFAMAGVLPVDVVVEVSSVSGLNSSDGTRNHTHIHVPTRRHQEKDAQRQRQGQLQLHSKSNSNTDLADADLLLPHVLSTFNKRIRALELRTTTVDEARLFLAALYSSSASSLVLSTGTASSDEEYPLESLVLYASSDGSHRLPHHHRRLRPHTRASFSSTTHSATNTITLPPSLPYLTHLTLYNHPLPTLSLSPENTSNLRELKVKYPLRFAPISVRELVGVLGAARGLKSVVLEGRVVDDIDTDADIGSAAGSVVHASTSTLTVTSTVTSTSTSTSTTSSSSSSQSHYTLPLPQLTSLSLRTNNIPAILARLLMPSLRSLSIDDLDGRRRGAGREMAGVMRGVLVRMDMPFEGCKERGRGLEVLDMCSVSLSSGGAAFGTFERGADPGAHTDAAAASASFSTAAGGGGGGGEGADEEKRGETAEALWSWCFARMRTLREMRVRKMDVEGLLRLVTPSLRLSPLRPSHRRTGIDHLEKTDDMDKVDKTDTPLPALRELVIIEQEVCHPRASAGLMRMNARGRGHAFSASSSSSISSTSTSTPKSKSSSTSSSPFSDPSAPQSLHSHAPTHPSITPRLKMFQLRRPDVEVVYEVVPVAGLDPVARARSGSMTHGNVDFLELYS